MKKICFSLIFFLVITISWSQRNDKTYKIVYQKSSNGKVIPNQDPIWVFANSEKTQITAASHFTKNAVFPFEVINVNNIKSSFVQNAFLSENKTVSCIDSLSLANQKFEITKQTKTILGYECFKAKTVVNSNSIEIWFTKKLGVKGAPSILGQNLGLVLQMIRNGNSVTEAIKIEPLKSFPTNRKSNTNPETMDILSYKDRIWKSRFVTIPVFENETICFSDKAKSNDSILRFANGTIIVKKVKFPEIKKGNLVFAAVTQNSNGDAYDRTGSVFVIPTGKDKSFMDGLKNGVKALPIYENGNGKKYQGMVATADYEPITELMRFFTSFGVKQYNYLELKDKVWQEKVLYRQEITDLSTVLSNQEVWVGMNIGNYDQGGHKASLEITIHKNEDTSNDFKWTKTLFNTNNIMEMAGQDYADMFNTDKGLEVSFEVPAGLENVQLRYTVTGHGGWENGDEFLKKKNTILLDNQKVHEFTPWRTDCGSYRLSNPASGNFADGLSSSDLSRSNWCPGTVTYPVYIDLGKMSPGKHSIRVQIPQGKPEGNSFSTWLVSGILLGR